MPRDKALLTGVAILLVVGGVAVWIPNILKFLFGNDPGAATPTGILVSVRDPTTGSWERPAGSHRRVPGFADWNVARKRSTLSLCAVPDETRH